MTVLKWRVTASSWEDIRRQTYERTLKSTYSTVQRKGKGHERELNQNPWLEVKGSWGYQARVQAFKVNVERILWEGWNFWRSI